MSRLEINSDALIDPALLDFSRTCRLCLHQATELSPLFPETEPSDAAVSSLPTKIMLCVSIEVLPEHNTMPKQVCSKCVHQIDSWVKFKELCESANSLLQQCLANLQPSNIDDAETLQNNFQGPDTILSDMDVSIFERDSLFGALEEGSLPLSDFNVSFSECMLNQKIQSIKKTSMGNTSTPMRINENCENEEVEVSKNILSIKIENFESSDDKEKPESPKGPSKWKLKYDECYRKSYPCDICNRVFTKFTHLLNHDRVEHYDRLNNSCDVCGMLFASKSRLEIHLLKHREKTFECSECYKMFVSNKSLSVHMRLHDPNNKYICGYCNLVRCSQRMLDDHVRSVHTKEALFRCDLCGREFKTKQSKDIHYSRHINKKLFKCGVCESFFINNNSYRSHMEKHKTVNDIICNVCGKLFKTNNSLNQHMRSHSVKAFKCLLCSSSFSQKYLLVRHEATHLNLHPFKCNICHKAFKRKDLLSSHTKKHTNDKRYCCNDCSDSFFTLQSLKTHKCPNANNIAKSNVTFNTTFMNFVNEQAEKITIVKVENDC